MAALKEKLCPVCFQETMERGMCQNCGYVFEEASIERNYLPPFTILDTKYLLGKSLGQGGFGITYLAENMLNMRTESSASLKKRGRSRSFMEMCLLSIFRIFLKKMEQPIL